MLFAVAGQNSWLTDNFPIVINGFRRFEIMLLH